MAISTEGRMSIRQGTSFFSRLHSPSTDVHFFFSQSIWIVPNRVEPIVRHSPRFIRSTVPNEVIWAGAVFESVEVAGNGFNLDSSEHERIVLLFFSRILFDRPVDTESSPSVPSQFTDKYVFTVDIERHVLLLLVLPSRPVLWRLSSRPELVESYRLHSHLHVHGHTRALAHHLQSKSSNRIHYDDSFDHVYKKSSSSSSVTRSSIELDHPYACSPDRINRALRTLMEPQPPSPSTSPPLPSSSPLTTAEQMMLISTPPTPPPSAHGEPSQPPSNDFTKTTYVLSPNPPFFSPHRQSYVIPSTSSSSSPTSSTCALVQFVQLHRILPNNKTHSFVSSTPVTPLDS